MNDISRSALSSRKVALLGLMAGAASILFTIESYIPMPLPWMRLGLANVVTLLALKWWGVKETALIFGIRLILGNILAGRLLSPLFIFSLSGGIAALSVMAILFRWEKTIFSLFGISVAGGVAHNIAQLFAAAISIEQPDLIRLFPLFILNGMLSGGIIGLLGMLLNARIQSVKLL